MSLTPRMIQNFTGETNLEPHWGYAFRVVPCKNDPGSCEYLDAVYEGHDIGMLYTGIFWASVLGLLLVWGIGRRFLPAREPVVPRRTSSSALEQQRQQKQSPFSRLRHGLASSVRTYLLPNATRSLFGHTTRLQVAILAVLIGYLTIFTFAGITYKIWLTPIAGQPPEVYNTRSGLGPWSDRIGVLAYALTPLSILLASRENLLSLITGVPYTSFLFLHRWTGYIILIQSMLHTIGWLIIEVRLYQPQPKVWDSFMANEYAIWGFVALGLLVLLWILSLGLTIRITGYEFFRKAHYVLAMLYIGAAIGHWEALQCFLVPGLVLWGVDRLARLIRTWVLHYGYISAEGTWGFRAAQAEGTIWSDEKYGDVVRLDFSHRQQPWKIGQHFFLCFTEGSIWQSHPFTPLSVPTVDMLGEVKHAYILRAKGGETKKIAEIMAKKAREMDGKQGKPTTSIVLQGPYGENLLEGMPANANILCVAGGTGITYVLPVLLTVVQGRVTPGRRIELVWAVKRSRDVEWVQAELDELRKLGAAHNAIIRIFVTDDDASPSTGLSEKGEEKKVTAVTTSSSASSDSASEGGAAGRPNVQSVVSQFVSEVSQGSTRVYGSGPPGMIGNLRAAVAKSNSGSKVWKGEERFDVSLFCDDRLEW
ncbi:putative ferric reductase transmembrane component [Podospora aff. communis PSN243]|uniref:Ferric reductase transmembrane component n=1 Tax=Podospora aff. communis PSN243 TaxID=3040156 RepID=A0AAV9GU35_9PEZI|nr:putative ferric reductase transmembrane component [Podospora aff. communis PSN243]